VEAHSRNHPSMTEEVAMIAVIVLAATPHTRVFGPIAIALHARGGDADTLKRHVVGTEQELAISKSSKRPSRRLVRTRDLEAGYTVVICPENSDCLEFNREEPPRGRVCVYKGSVDSSKFVRET